MCHPEHTRPCPWPLTVTSVEDFGLAGKAVICCAALGASPSFLSRLMASTDFSRLTMIQARAWHHPSAADRLRACALQPCSTDEPAYACWLQTNQRSYGTVKAMLARHPDRQASLQLCHDHAQLLEIVRGFRHQLPAGTQLILVSDFAGFTSTWPWQVLHWCDAPQLLIHSCSVLS